MFGLFLIWLGGFLTGFAVGQLLQPEPQPQRVRVKSSDLYPPKDQQ